MKNINNEIVSVINSMVSKIEIQQNLQNSYVSDEVKNNHENM